MTHLYIIFHRNCAPGSMDCGDGIVGVYALYGFILALYLVANFGSMPFVVDPSVLDLALGLLVCFHNAGLTIVGYSGA